MQDGSQDDMQALEAEIARSRFQAWDAEAFLINRHKSRIDALTETRGQWRERWQVTREIADVFCLFAGRIAVIAAIGVGLLIL